MAMFSATLSGRILSSVPRIGAGPAFVLRVHGNTAVLDEGPVSLPQDWLRHVQFVET